MGSSVLVSPTVFVYLKMTNFRDGKIMYSVSAWRIISKYQKHFLIYYIHIKLVTNKPHV